MNIREFRKAIITTVICNSLVWYDYALYGSLIEIISQLFFPAGDKITLLISAFTVFAIGFIMRPVGSLFFGHIGDKHGRKLALIISVISMSIPAFLIAILPTYKTIGISATASLILIRMLQGFSLGGEAGNAVFLIEHSPKKLHGFFGSFEVLSAVIGAIFSTIMVALFRKLLGVEQFLAWGWRIPFLIGALIGALGTILRFQVAESPAYREELLKEKEQHSLPFHNIFKNYKKKLLIAIGIDSIEEASLYVFLIFIGSYIANFTNVNSVSSSGSISKEAAQAFFEETQLLFLIALGALTLFFAYLSDIWGRKPVLMFSAIMLLVFSYPIFYLLELGVNGGSMWNIIVSETLLIIIIAASLGPVSTTVVEMFPANVTYTGLAFSRNIASALFGGFAPSACIFLIKITGNNNAAAFYLMFCACIGIISLLFLKKVKVE